MIRKILLISVFISIAAFTAAAQGGAQVRGEVKLKNADGTLVPLAGAVVEGYQTDAGGKGVLQAATTNAKGQFAFVSVPFGQVYALVASGPGARASVEPNVKAGRENIVITLEVGDGAKPTEADVRQALAASANPASAADQKKAQAEFEAKKAEVDAKNMKIEQENVIISRSLQEGNAAFTAKNWDAAIAKYSEGMNAAPDFAGSAPVLLNNKGAALRERAVARYNATVKLTDPTAKVEGYKAVKADLGEAVDGYNRSITLIKNAQPTDITDPKVKESQTLTALNGARDTLRLMAQTEQVDETKLEMAKAIIPEYLAKETDPEKKESAKLILADIYRVAGDADNAITEYRKVMEASPDNLDAMAGLGLSLVNAGYINDNKQQLQEGANILQKFASAAPDSHKYKDDAVGLIESLKTDQKITPQKVTPARRRNN